MIRTLTEIQNDLADNQERLITPERLRNFADSAIAVGGTMFGNNEVISVTTSWSAFSGFTNSQDTKGIVATEASGLFTIGTGADGIYMLCSTLCLSCASDISIDLAIVKNGGLTPFALTADIPADVRVPIALNAGGNLIATDAVGLAIKADIAVNVTLDHGSLIAARV